MDSKPPVQAAKPLRRRAHVVYYLSRGAGQMDHPHLLEGYISAAQDGLRLRDFKRWLAVLRGKSMPSTFAWSYKRTYKNGFIWHDLGDNDLIQPLSKNEYVLMGSEIRNPAAILGKCKCGGLQQQMDAKVVAELGNVREKPLNKSVLRSPTLVAKNNTEDDRKIAGGVQNRSNSGRLISSDNVVYNNKMINKSGMQYRGGSSRSFNELTTQRLLEEVKRPTNYQEVNKLSVGRSFNQSQAGINSRVLIQDSELITVDHSDIVEEYSNNEVQGDLYEAGREMRKGNSNSPYVQKASSRRDYNKGGHHEDMMGVMSDSQDNDDDINGAYIMDAATQTGDSTRCSTDHQDGATMSAGYNNRLELGDSPGTSSKYSEANGYLNAADAAATMRASSAKFNKNHCAGSAVTRRSLSKQLSREFSNFPDVEKAMMISQTSDLGEDAKTCHVASSNNTSVLNHMGSPALSTCSAMSTRSTRFAREDNKKSSMPGVARNSSKRSMTKPSDSHHTHHKGSSHSSSSITTPQALLKQLLKCGDADVITESKPSGHVIMKSNALAGLETPSRFKSTSACQGGLISGYEKKGSNANTTMWAFKPGLMMKRTSAASSDNKSVISATVSDQASIRDTLEMISSPESVYNNGRLRSNIMKANSVNYSSSGARAAIADAGASVAANGSPGMLSVGSSTSRRSSIRESDMNLVYDVGNIEEGFRETLRSHHVGVGFSPKTRLNKGNKNTALIHDILDNEVGHECRSMVETNGTTRGAKSNSTSIRELHKLICNPSGTPTCSNNHNKVISSSFATTSLERHAYNTARDRYMPQHHQSHHILIATHGASRTPTRSSNLNSPNLVVLSKSLNSPSTPMFLEEISQPPPSSSSYISSWKDLLWSPRHNSSHKEKEKRHMKP